MRTERGSRVHEIAIEFYGGPWDGEVHGFQGEPPEELELHKLPSLLTLLVRDKSEHPSVRKGIYRAGFVGNEPGYIWYGEQ